MSCNQVAERRSQVGTGDRSEKIRTYNFPQGRVTDHRIKYTSHRLNEILDGDINEVLDNIIAADQAARLAKSAGVSRAEVMEILETVCEGEGL